MLEDRLVLNAALNSIAPVTVPSSLGFQVVLDGSASGAAKQTFTATSSNPDIKVSVAQGQFITLNVAHTSSGSGDASFSGPIVYQAFNDLTPNTATRIEALTNAGGFNTTQIFRVVKDFVFQGGPQGSAGNGNHPLELNQKLAFTQPGAVAIANANPPSGGGSTDGNQFFVTFTPQTNQLDYKFTLYGQVVSGQTLVNDINNVAVNGAGTEFPMPVTPITITTSTVSSDNPNGVLHVDATGAIPGETATVKVIATDPTTHTTAQQTFTVTVVTNNTPLPPTLTYKPLAFPVSQQLNEGTSATIQLNGQTNNPNNPAVKIQFTIATQPLHGTLSQFNPSTGTVVYTPNSGFAGADSFTYAVSNIGGSPSPLAGNTGTVTLTVTPVVTGFVRVIGTVLVVSPQPNPAGGANNIVVAQTNNVSSPANDLLVVTVNGVVDELQPTAQSINRIVIYGSKAGDTITVLPSVDKTINVTLDGGHGHGLNSLHAGAGPTRLHGWFGHNILAGGAGPNELVGRAGHVKFLPTSTTDEIFAGVPHPGYTDFDRPAEHPMVHIQPPGGTFYKFVNGHLVPIPTPRSRNNAPLP
jgi:cyclophilin family peptidyl-prolyl cis-trans isomerase